LKLLEYEAKEYFKKYGIPVPLGSLAKSPEDAREVAKKVGKPVAIKAQVPVGGRGKAGGIKFAEIPREAEEVAKGMLGSDIKGISIEELYIEEKLNILEEIYLGVTVDRDNKRHVVLTSSEGGVEIEEVARESPEKVFRYLVDPVMGLRSYHADLIAKEVGLTGQRMIQFAVIVQKLYTLAVEMDAELAEINPLAIVESGFTAADAKLLVDNNSLFRHKELESKMLHSYRAELTEREMEAREQDLTYVELEGNIGVVGNGAGLTMATLDTIMLHGGEAANFLDLGGGATPERIDKAVKFVLKDDRTKVLFVNVLGGITKCDDIAKGIIEAREETNIKKPVVVRMIGTNEEEGKRLLKEAGIETHDTMEEGAKLAVDLAKEG
jgi:succinyl-CoA synthetase beta subunit